MIHTRRRADAATRVSTWAISHARPVRPVRHRAGALGLDRSARTQGRPHDRIDVMDRPRHPAIWSFTGGAFDGGFDNFGAYARMLVTKSASYRARATNGCCPTRGNIGVDVVVVEREVLVDVDVREVVVPCEGWKSGPRRRYALRKGASPVAVGMGGGQDGRGTRHVPVSERFELLAEGVRVGTGEF